MNTKAGRLFITLSLGLGLTLALLWLLGNCPLPVIAAPAAELHVCPSGCTYSSVQVAVDAASDGDIIKVAAGTYTDIHQRNGIAQVVYISKTVTIQGGYTTMNWATSNPGIYTTTLDAQEQGRVLYISGDINVIIEGLHITDGQATPGENGSSGGDGTDGADGGGIYIAAGAVVTVTDTIIIGNKAGDGGDGGVGLLGNTGGDGGDGGSGGGVYIASGAVVTLDSIGVVSNTAGDGGNGGNTDTLNVFGGASGDGGSGGAIYSNGVLTLIDSFLIGNTSGARGIWGCSPNFYCGMFGSTGDGGGLYQYTGEATVVSNTVASNTSTGDGGGVYVYSATMMLDGSTVVSNSADHGGGLYLSHNDMSAVAETTVTLNSATDHGGGLYVYSSTMTLSNSVIVSNTTDEDGGGVYLSYSDGAILSGNRVISNTAGDDGGGLHVDRSDNFILGGNTVISNTAQSGGGVYLYESNATLNGNTISGNIATWDGGGVYLYESDDAGLSENVVASNIAGDDGGGLYLSWNDNVMLSGNIVISNTTLGSYSRGGGLYLDNSNMYDDASATLIENTVASNTAGEDGGGLYLDNRGIAVVIGNFVAFNIADGDGGGGLVLGYSWSHTTFSENRLISNTAQSGGGLYLYGGDVMLTNNVVADNRANTTGSGVYIVRSSSLLLHTTIARNTGGDGSGIYVTGSSGNQGIAVLTNTILVSQTLGIYVTVGNTATLESTLWYNNGTYASGSGTIIANNNHFGDPAFVNPNNSDYHIGTESAARDVGIDAMVTNDIDGHVRPMGWGYDIGADEYATAALSVAKHSSEVFINRGQTLTYTLVITNSGMESAAGVILTDTLDAWQQPITATASVGTCSIVDGGWGGTTVCTPGVMMTGTNAVVTLTAQVSTAVPVVEVMVNGVVVTANEVMSATAQITTYAQDCHVRINDDPIEYVTVQAAVDAASPDDLVKVAGYCVGSSERAGVRQQVYLDKSITIQGGYSSYNWTIPDPESNPTTLDALGLGRVIYITGDISPTIESLRITGGNATDLGGDPFGTDAGGGMYVVTATATISNNYVFSNTVSWYGGGLYLLSNAATLNGNTITSNTAAFGGGLELDLSPATLSNNTVMSNTAHLEGGGLFLWYSDARLTGNTVSDNEAGDGGGMLLWGSSATLNENTVTSNVADYGGGVYLYESNAMLNRNTISGNWAAYYGGGLCLNSSSDMLVNNVVAGNRASIAGSGLFVYDSLLPLLHTTVADNTGGDGSGLYVSGSSIVVLTNTVLVSHTVGITVTSGSTVTLEATLWGTGTWANTTDWGGTGTIITGTINIWGDPAFVSPETGNYHISLNSSAIDKGIYAGVSEDIDGQPRPQGSGYDLGADETGLMIIKRATPDPAQPGEPLTYTISITNTSHVTLTATITDILPAQVTPSGSLTWTASITASGGVWTEQFTVTVGVGYTGVLTNVVQVATEEGAIGAYTHTISTLPIVDFDNPSYDIGEGGSLATITVTLSQTSALTATVNYTTGGGTATAGEDYTSASGTLVFTPGVTSQIFTVPIAQDGSDEYDETVTLTLSNADNAIIGDNNPATLTIEDDDDPPSLGISDTSVTEGDSGNVSAVFTVTLSVASGKAVTVEYATTDGGATVPDDYTAISTTTLVFDPGITTRLVTVTVKGDTLDEENETFFVNLANATNAGISDGLGQGTIFDDDGSPTLSISDVSVTEGDSGSVSAVFTVTLSDASGKSITVEYATTDGSAAAPADYTAVLTTMLTFDPGATTQLVTVTVQGDTLDEDNEVFFVNLSNATNASLADDQGQGTIDDDDVSPSFSISDVNVVEGDSGSVSSVFSVTLSSASGRTATVEYATANGSATAPDDYTTIFTTTLVFDPGITTQFITVAVKGDTLDEEDEVFFVNLANATNASLTDGQGQGVIQDDDAQPSLSVGDTTVAEGDSGGVSAVFTVTLSVASGKPITVAYTTADGNAVAPDDYTAISTTTLAFDPGEITQLVTVTVKGDTLDEDNETFFVNLDNATNAAIADGQGQGTILDDDGPPSFSISDVSVLEGDSGGVSAVFTVTLSVASGKPITVAYATADGSAIAPDDYTAISTTTLTFNPGVTTRLVTVTVEGDTLDEEDETFLVNLADPVNAGISDGQGQGTILDDDVPPALSISDASVVEGDSGSVSAVFTVTLSDVSSKMITVEYATVDGSATAPADYAAIPTAMLTFNPGEITQQVTVTVKGDTMDEANETFSVNLVNATNATIADGQGEGTIQDDDGPPTVSFSSTTYSVNEDAGTVDILVTLNVSSALTVTVGYTATGGTATPGEDYEIVSGTLTFTPGVTSRTITVTIIDDEVDEGEETIILTLYDPNNATIGSGTTVLTITEEFKVYLPLVVRNFP